MDIMEILSAMPEPQEESPARCPFCGGTKILQSPVQWIATSEHEESEEITEYQCQGTCQGRSFWV